MKVYHVLVPAVDKSHYITSAFVTNKQSYVCKIEYTPEDQTGAWRRTIYYYSDAPFTVKARYLKTHIPIIEETFVEMVPDKHWVVDKEAFVLPTKTAYNDLLNWKNLYENNVVLVNMSKKDYKWILNTLELLEIGMP